MMDRVQITCEKQGRNDTGSWSTRVLTIDVATATLTVSRHHHPNNLLYHSIQLRDVQQWPHFPHSVIDDDYNSLHAKRTLVVLGIEVPVPSFSCEELEAGGPHEDHAAHTPLPNAHGTDAVSDTSASSGSPYAFMTGDSSKHSRPIESGGYDSWAVRFTTQEAYDTAVAVLRRMHGVHFNRTHNVEVLTATVGMPVPLIAAPLGPL